MDGADAIERRGKTIVIVGLVGIEIESFGSREVWRVTVDECVSW